MATSATFTISGQLVDLHLRRIYPAQVSVSKGKIKSIEPLDEAPFVYILPGFIDAHIHIESSMLPPSSFARIAVQHGTVATVSDPHEIANVCGVAGVQYMLDNAAGVPFHFFFGAPSCVPATTFETAGAEMDAAVIDLLLRDKNIWYLSEMMNYPAVLNRDAEVMKKIKSAKRYGKPIDGHAPGLKGMDAKIYASAGITTDHECTNLDEALEKIAAKMNILIREGSAAKNYDALHFLIQLHPEKVMFCCDDKHPDELMRHHINHHVERSIQLGYDLFDVLNIACVHPVNQYKLPVGLLREGDAADFIVVEDLQHFKVIDSFINGEQVVKNYEVQIPFTQSALINQFDTHPISVNDIAVAAKNKTANIQCIVAHDGQLITSIENITLKSKEQQLVSDTAQDVLKIVVVNRYLPNQKPAIGFIKGFGLKQGAIASTVAHDSHNIIAVGATDEDLVSAINALIEVKGGLSCVQGEEINVMPLRIAGLMHDGPPEEVAQAYEAMDAAAKKSGSTLAAPYMTLSFMALLVIPSLKMSDLGLFDGNNFSFTSLQS